jgi:cytosolic phospholipase A2
MCATRTIFSQCRFRYGTLGAAASFGLHGYFYQSQRTSFDGPTQAQLPRDHGLIAQGRRTLAQQAFKHPSSDKIDGGLISEKEGPGIYTAGFENDDESAWASFSRDVDSFRLSLTDMDWGSVGDTITNFIMPAWARQLPDQVRKLQFELSMEPGTLAHDIWQEAADVDINPEVMWDASVRVSNDLCDDELRFQSKRRERLVPALATYLNIDEKDINPEDVPIIALCGSGGGLRALVAGTGSYLAAQQDGLFDCVTYTAGVSGSCWLQTLYHTSMGKQNFHNVSRHLKHRIGVHVAFPPAAFKLLSSAPTHKHLLSGFIEKLKGDPGADFGLVDIYGLLVAARLLVPKGELGVSDRDLKLSNQRLHLDEGAHPMPIYTAVRHEIPIDQVDVEDAADDVSKKQEIKEKAKREAWFQWFEFTPYEVFCEEFSAGIPTWALGRPFKSGRNQTLESGLGLPEIRIPLLLGIWGSAFCATLSHYYKEIKPALIGVAGFGGLDNLLAQRNEDLVKIHPIDPATIPNFVYGMEDQLPSSCPGSIFKTDHIQLMDAGMSNNLPIYPLLRPGRNVDILVAFDASADIKKENWLSVVDGYARQRGIKGWPIGAGWPKASSRPAQTAQALDEAQPTTAQEAASKVAEARESQRQTSSATSEAVTQGTPTDPSSPDLGYCTVWVGSTSERITSTEPPPSKRLDCTNADASSFPESSFHLLSSPTAGLTLIYFPLLPNESKVPGVDPDTSEYMSTWNSIYTPEEIEKVMQLARANFEEGREQTRRVVRAVYERRRKGRVEREVMARERAVRRRVMEGGDHFLA